MSAETASESDPQPPAPPKDRALLAWMLGFLRPVRGRAVAAAIALIAWIAAEVLAVSQTALAVNTIAARTSPPSEAISAPETGDPLNRALLGLAVVSVALAVLMYFREVANASLSMHLVYHIRAAVYDRLQRAALRFHDSVSTGELINRAFNDLQNVRSFVTNGMLLAIETVLIVGGYTALVLTRSPWAALLAVLPLPLWTWYVLRFSSRVRPLQKEVMEAGDRNTGVLTENISGVQVVKSFGTQSQEIARFAASCGEFFRVVMQRIRLYANFTPVMRGISMGSHLLLFLAAGLLMLRGRMQPGDVLLLGAAMGAILTRLQQAAQINEQYQNALVSARRLHEVLAAPTAESEAADLAPLPAGRGAVRFENVTFGYRPESPVLHDVSFEVAPGSVVALVGPTGAGKTTLAQLLARLYSPQRGRILIDGFDIAGVTLESLRTQISFVFQETYLFSDTIAANVAYAHPESGAAEIERAVGLAGADEFITGLPRGFQTPLGERGANLSGGQRQRLAIARALHANPRILILDDATAAVDSETELLIRTKLREFMSGRTTFVIAHRISTVQQADLVLVIEAGRITASGTHAELMERDGHYREIAAVQLGTDEEDPRQLARHDSRDGAPSAASTPGDGR